MNVTQIQHPTRPGDPWFRVAGDETGEVPDGYECNLGSVPRWLWWYLHPSADVVAFARHDYRYQHRTMSRYQADVLLMCDLLLNNYVQDRKAYAAFAAVRLFGGLYYGGGKRLVHRDD